MKKIFLFPLCLTALTLLALAGCSRSDLNPTSPAEKTLEARNPGFERSQGGKIVVANRASGTISVISARTGQLSGTYDLPRAEGEPQPAPMYVNSVAAHQRVFVGDRANNRVVVFDSRTFAVEAAIPAGQGVFHQWVDPQGSQLWVNGDIDNTITVIDPASLEVLATIAIPADLVAMGGKPHDVILGQQGRFAYVTVLGIDGPNDYLLQFSAATFEELNRRAVGKDPHLSLGTHTDLYVPCQNSDQVLVFDRKNLQLKDEISVPGAHGAAMSANGKYFYTTNLPNGGSDALYTISTRRNQVLGEPVATPYAVPHNLALTPNGKRLFVTHSGGESDKVTIYRLMGKDRLPEYMAEVTVGLNPFGLGYVY